MKVALLTCGRSDFSIYYPLLKQLEKDSFFNTHIIAFGTHVSVFHGETIQDIIKNGFQVSHKIESLVLGDSPEAVATAMGLTSIKFASLWAAEQYDLIVVLGDRYEMFAAAASSVPFNIPIAHLHGGETTLGAIDDIFRHCITIMSKFHFTSTNQHAQRVKELLGHDTNIYNVGALSLDNIRNQELMTRGEFMNAFGIDLSIPTVLATFHPETVNPATNETYARILMEVFSDIDDQIVLTMPNADTMGNAVRSIFSEFLPTLKHVKAIETLGMKGYFTCMNACTFVLGNSSSGIIEAASFGKYAINIGDRQKGRSTGKNVMHCQIKKDSILEAIAAIPSMPDLDKSNIYGDGHTAEKIVKVLKQIYV